MPFLPTTVTRLSPEVYAELAKQFPTLHINEQTTPVQVAFSLGVEKVLKKLREGLVVGDVNA